MRRSCSKAAGVEPAVEQTELGLLNKDNPVWAEGAVRIRLNISGWNLT